MENNLEMELERVEMELKWKGFEARRRVWFMFLEAKRQEEKYD